MSFIACLSLSTVAYARVRENLNCFLAGSVHPLDGVAVYPTLPGKKQAMEMTEYGKLHDAGFPPFPHSLEIPPGFPHSHGLDDWIMSFRAPQLKP